MDKKESSKREQLEQEREEIAAKMHIDDQVGQWDEFEKELSVQIQHEFRQEQPKEIAEKKPFYAKYPKWCRISFLVFFIILLFGLTTIRLAAFGKNMVYLVLDTMLNSEEFDNTMVVEEFEQDDDLGFSQVNPEDVQWIETDEPKRKEKDIINILLVGEEAIGDGPGRGRTDCIMLATVNVKQKALKLTSFMRDMYVQIPGYNDNKLNAAYHNGGIPLLEQTLENTFNIEIDGAVLVNFDGFEEIIDKLGGVELTLTSSEAYYLNTSNYISNPSYRNVRTGKQNLNGNQALGYMRIRYVETSEKVRDDFGRTSRQRALLNAIFDKYKSKSLPEILILFNDILPLVTTNIQKDNLISYITTVVTMGTLNLETLQIPANNAYDGIYVRNMAVLSPHMPENINILKEFIFGPDATAAIADQGSASSSGVSAETNSQEGVSLQ